MNLVERLEDEEISLVCKLLCYLAPHRGDLLLDLFMYSRINCCCLDIQPELAVCSVVMDIHNSIQASGFCVSHDFRNSIEPRLFYLIIRSFAYMS